MAKKKKSDNEDVNGLNEDDTRGMEKIIMSQYENTFVKKLEEWKNYCIRDNFNAKNYATLYMLIEENYKEWFLKKRSFSGIQKALDPFFGIDTTSYKKCKVKNKIESLKISFPWVRYL